MDQVSSGDWQLKNLGKTITTINPGTQYTPAELNTEHS